MKLVGCGGGAASLVPYCARKMGLQYSIPENAEVISSIGVSLAMVRDVVERVIPNPTEKDIADIKKEAKDACIESGAAADTVEVHIEIDNQSGKVTAIATGSTEVKTTDLLKECTEEEARQLAEADFGPDVTDVHCVSRNDCFYVFSGTKGDKTPLRIVDKKGFIKVQCSNARAKAIKAAEYSKAVEEMWDDLAIYKSETILRPDYYLCVGPRVCDYSATDLDQNKLLMNLDVADRGPDEEILVVGDCCDLF